MLLGGRRDSVEYTLDLEQYRKERIKEAFLLILTLVLRGSVCDLPALDLSEFLSECLHVQFELVNIISKEGLVLSELSDLVRMVVENL